jgi:hypothetical protein
VFNQTSELARVKAKIRALTEKTVANGCTEAEAMSAADMVGRLLERYALSMDEIEVRESRCIQVEVPLAGNRRGPVDGCVPAIARFCDCKVWLARGSTAAPAGDVQTAPPAVSRYVFFGFETDTALAVYLLAIVSRAVETETTAFRRGNPQFRGPALRQATASFQHGVVARVADRLTAMHEAREATVRARRSTGSALMLVEEAFRQIDVRLRTASVPARQVIKSAYHEGWNAGDRIDLDRPVRGNPQGMIG